MTNLRSFLILLIFSLFLFLGCEKQHDMQMLQVKVDAMNEVMVKAMMENDQDIWVKLYAEDCVSLPSYEPMIRGLEDMKAQIEKQKDMPMNFKSFDLKTTDLKASGNFVVDIGTYEMVMEWPDAPGGVWSDKGKYLTIYEIQQDGSLLIAADTWNTDSNPWEQMAASQAEEKK